MKTTQSFLKLCLIILAILYVILYNSMPKAETETADLKKFSSNRALYHVEKMTEKPHFIGSKNHAEVAHYVAESLRDLGLEVSTQEGYTFSDWGTLTKCKNILAKIKGSENGKALLLMSHYDSAPHSFSHGASDDAAGVATILESVRAFIHNKTPHKNDIIILFTDAEELGLNGAALFAAKHPWANDIGVALNFEARGTSGPSYMLMEVSQGNSKMVNEFVDANPAFANSNSLMYSIYKMLPNDTDLTVFRSQKAIQGFNFAYIDDHFNYHTQQDDFAHLNVNSLQHHGAYLMPLLGYFANADLSDLSSTQDDVYFSIPFGFIHYPFDWVMPLCILTLVLFVFIVFIGFVNRTLNINQVGRGFFPFVISLVIVALILFFGWKILLKIYPQYNDILQGFTYNGHDYLAAFIILALGICFWCYEKFSCQKEAMNHFLAPLFIWLLANFGIAFFLKGAGFLVIPLFSALLLLAYYVFTQRTPWFLVVFTALPALVILVPFIEMFPVALGLKMLFASGILLVLCFGLLVPFFGMLQSKRTPILLCFLIAFGYLIKAHFNSGYEPGKAKPNSLVYYFDATQNKAYWTTYDKNLDEWTKSYLGENPKTATELNNTPLSSKYNTAFTFLNETPVKTIPKPKIEFLRDSIDGNKRFLKIKISPTRLVNRYDVFSKEANAFRNLVANGETEIIQNGSKFNRESDRIVRYYVVDNAPLILEFWINRATKLDLDLFESSFDLLSNPVFSVAKRQDWMMPMPFVLNDAIVIKQKIKRTYQEINNTTPEKIQIVVK
jgi:Peptidase family M28